MLLKILGRLVALAPVLTLGCSSTPTDEGMPSTPSAGDTTVLDACLDFAARLCDDAAGCCMATYDGYDHDACIENFRRNVCRPGADAVMAGFASFDEGAVEACVAAHAQAHAICVPTWSETLELRKAIYSACRVINGKTAPGRGCTTAVTCQRPEGVGTAECVKNTCREVELLGEGAACTFPDGLVSVCDSGLTCSAAGIGTDGVCQKAVAPGNACDASVLESTECGLGSYCDAESERCRLADNFGGVGCEQGTECVSFECDRIGNECAPAPAVVSRETCAGSAANP